MTRILFSGHSHDARKDAAQVPWHLRGGVDNEPVTVHPRVGHVRLKRRALDPARRIRAFNDRVSGAQSVLHVSRPTGGACREVVRCIRANAELVDDLREVVRVDRRQLARHGVFEGKNGRDDIVFDFDQGKGMARGFSVFRDHRRHPVSHMAHGAAEHPVVIGRRLREALPCLTVGNVRARAMVNYRDHAGKRLGTRRINALDESVSMGTSKHGKNAAARFNPVFHVRFHPGNKLHAVDLPSGLADHAQAVTEGRGHGRGPSRVLAAFSSQLHREEELLVARRPAEEPRKGVTNVVLGGCLSAAKQLLQEQRRGRRVERGLDHPGVYHGFLEHGRAGSPGSSSRWFLQRGLQPGRQP